MTLTTGYEFTTAATNVFNAAVTALLAWKLIPSIKPKQRRLCWGIVFCLFFAVCIFGAAIHGIAMEQALKSYLWHYLFTLLAFMLASFVTALVYETDGLSGAKRTAAVTHVMAFLFSVLRFVFPTRIKFAQFSIYAILLLLYAIGKLISARKEKPYLNHFLIGIFFLVTGSILQTIRSIKFHIILDFDYNSVYHLFTLFLILCVYIGLKTQQEAK